MQKASPPDTLRLQRTSAVRTFLCKSKTSTRPPSSITSVAPRPRDVNTVGPLTAAKALSQALAAAFAEVASTIAFCCVLCVRSVGVSGSNRPSSVCS